MTTISGITFQIVMTIIMSMYIHTIHYVYSIVKYCSVCVLLDIGFNLSILIDYYLVTT